MVVLASCFKQRIILIFWWRHISLLQDENTSQITDGGASSSTITTRAEVTGNQITVTVKDRCVFINLLIIIVTMWWFSKMHFSTPQGLSTHRIPCEIEQRNGTKGSEQGGAPSGWSTQQGKQGKGRVHYPGSDSKGEKRDVRETAKLSGGFEQPFDTAGTFSGYKSWRKKGK